MSRRSSLVAAAAVSFMAIALAGCAARVPTIASAPPPPPIVVEVAAPAPVALSTINRNLSRAGTLWHVRVGLNVAALACRGAREDAIIAGYNALLAAHKSTLAQTEQALSGEFQATGGKQWRDRYDDAMTKLYNFYSQAQAREGFCVAAGEILATAPSVTTASIDAFAQESLARLDRPFAIAFAPVQFASRYPAATPVTRSAPTLTVNVSGLDQ